MIVDDVQVEPQGRHEVNLFFLFLIFVALTLLMCSGVRHMVSNTDTINSFFKIIIGVDMSVLCQTSVLVFVVHSFL